MKTIDPTILADLCAEIAENTDCNNHGNAILIACKCFGYTDLSCVLSSVILLHDRAGHISSDLLFIRKRIFETMMINIFNDYGKDVYNLIKKSY